MEEKSNYNKRKNSKRLYRAVRNVLNEYGLNEDKINKIIKQEVEHYIIKHAHGLLASENFQWRFQKIITDALNKEMELKYPQNLEFILKNMVAQWIKEKLENIVDIKIKGKENEKV